MDIAFLLNKLEIAPAGFGFSDVAEWLQDVPQIETLTSIEKVFFEKLSKKQWLALLTLIKQRYIKDGPAYNLFDDYFEHYAKQNKLVDFYRTLYLCGDKSKVLDFTILKKQLVKLLINNCFQLTTLMLPKSKQLEAMELNYLPSFYKLDGIEQLKEIRFLAINKCPLLTDFSFIKKFNYLIWLDLSDNPQLVDINFLSPSHKIVMLQLLNTHLLDNPINIKQLAKLKYLRYLTISGHQQQIAQLREKLPYCVVNGMAAISCKENF